MNTWRHTAKLITHPCRLDYVKVILDGFEVPSLIGATLVTKMDEAPELILTIRCPVITESWEEYQASKVGEAPR